MVLCPCLLLVGWLSGPPPRAQVKFGRAGDVALFSGSMGVLMHFLAHERGGMGALLRKVLDRFVNVSAKPQYHV